MTAPAPLTRTPHLKDCECYKCDKIKNIMQKQRHENANIEAALVKTAMLQAQIAQEWLDLGKKK